MSRADYLQTTEFANISVDVTPRVHVELGTVHFHSSFNTKSYGGFWYSPQSTSGNAAHNRALEAPVGVRFTGEL